MSSTPREIGTLVAVILKANHLPNKRNIGKQDPYCVVSVNGEKQRTKVIKRGGQHPEWDEELRFKLYEDQPVTANGPDGAPPPLPPKDGKKNIKGGSVMKLSCFADDPREPSLIGQTDVDLTEVLTKGETDEWFTLLNKDKFAGKVYLELTFWSNEAPPEKKVVPMPQNNKEYAGPGSFVASDVASDYRHPSSRVVSTGDVYAHSRRQSDSGQSIRPSNSLAQLDLYRPAYEVPEPHHRSRVASFSTLTNDFAELGVDSHRRRESLPPAQSDMFHTRPPSVSYHRATYPPPHGYELSTSDAASMYQYDRPVTPPGPSSDPSTFVNPAPYTLQAPYRPQYEAGPVYNPPPSRGPRYSSGFMPISNSNSSGFVPIPSHPSDPSGFNPPTPAPPSGYPPYPSQTPVPGYAHPLPPSASADFHPHPASSSGFNPPPPAPSGYPPSHMNPSTSYPSQTPAPGYAASLRPSSSVDFHPQPGFPPSQSHYSQFQSQPPLQQYNPPPQTHPTPPSQPGYALSASPSNQSPAASLSHSNSLSSSTGPGSRPLPPPPQFQAAQGYQSYGLPPGAGQPAHPGSYSPTPPGVSTFQENYQPPPPPRPVSLHEASPQLYPGDPQGNLVPPPPPALSPPQSTSPLRRTSLPPTPNYAPLPVPPPPPPPLEYPPPPPPPLPSHIMPPHAQSYYLGPPPRPPTQIDGGQAQWGPPPVPLQNNYVQHGWS
ncbi:hypothetical protein C8R45DRAFT_958655 [Mycena sanguinolenta]|nr:hypothetical protein C8R45DRAFT_958655 [Mycena sanguinolenta]